jgi:Protein of unknown function DUF262/HNH endonuclease
MHYRRARRGVGLRMEFKPVALTPEIGTAVRNLIQANERRLLALRRDMPVSATKDLPLFPAWDAVKELADEGSTSFSLLMCGEAFHVRTDVLSARLMNAITSLSVPSERTGGPLRVFPTRLRRTLANESVIDGQQRLTSFFDFLDGKLKLKGLRVREELNGLKFAELSKGAQSAIKKTPLRAITIKRESDKDLKFEIFERLNSGSVALNDQELRNCIYRGPYIRLLKELSEDPDFRTLLNLSGPDKRMRDVEMVLRFAAFYHATYLKFSPPMKSFMNSEMEEHQHLTTIAQDKLRLAFKKSCQLVFSLFAEHAFKRFYRGNAEDANGRWEQKKINSSLYDVLMFGFTAYEKPQIYTKLDGIREAFVDLMANNDTFIGAIELSTSSKQAVETRFDLWRTRLKEVVGAVSTEPRCFTFALKSALYKKDATCAICKQMIASIDDSAVDHIELYWQGGKTISENARLTHRYCNWSRSKGSLSNKVLI